MKLICALFFLLSMPALCLHPLCTHPLYNTITDSNLETRKQKMPKQHAEFLEPIYVAAMLQEFNDYNDEKLDSSSEAEIFVEIKTQLRNLLINNQWFKLSKNNRKIIYNNKNFANQLKNLNLSIEATSSSSVFSSIEKIQTILQDEKFGHNNHKFKDLIEIILNPSIKQALGPALKQICLNLPPVKLEKISGSLIKIDQRMAHLFQDNIDIFSEILEKEFGLAGKLTPEKFITDGDLSKVNDLINLKNILQNKEYEINNTTNIIFNLLNSTSKKFSTLIKEKIEFFLKKQEVKLTYLITENTNFIEFFKKENVWILDEFTQNYKIKSLRLNQGFIDPKNYYLFFNRIDLQKGITDLSEIIDFIVSMKQQLATQGIEADYADYLRTFYNYDQSHKFSSNKIKKELKIAVDKSICAALGLNFPCFNKLKIIRTKFSQKALAISDKNLARLKKDITNHLDNVADALLILLSESKDRDNFAQKLIDIRHLCIEIYTLIKNSPEESSDEWLQKYNDLRRRLDIFRRQIIQIVKFEIYNNSYRFKELDHENIFMYLNERIAHFI